MRLKRFMRLFENRRSIASFVLRAALGLVFLYTGYAKLRQPWYVFAGMIDNYGVVPPQVSEVIARVLPALEVILGSALLVGLYRKLSSAATVVVLVPFFVLMLQAYIRGMTIDCGCFGQGQTLGIRTLMRDGVLVAASLWLAFLSWHTYSTPDNKSSID
jgi:uncharacterized membrane protein YphA (DoxX/SURF4 family)